MTWSMDFSDSKKDADDYLNQLAKRKMTPEVMNSISLAFLDLFYERIKEIEEQLQKEQNNIESDDHPTGVPFKETPLQVYQLHSMTTSYYEASTPVLCFHHLYNETVEGLKIAKWMEDNREFIFDDESEKNAGGQTMEWLVEGASITDMARILKDTELIPHDKIKRVRTDRNKFLHNPFELLVVSEWDEILSKTERCVEVSADMNNRLHSDIELHSIYDELSPREF